MIETSIIIPTCNEEKYLPGLLESIKKQKYKNYEIIIADANSKDKTIKIAKRYKCKVVKGGKPARGRNKGAKIAKGKYLIFMDSDGILKNNKLEKLIKEFRDRGLDLASVYVIPHGGNIIDEFFHLLWNAWAGIMQYFDPYFTGAFIICKKNVFKKLKGFDEKVSVGEDHALARDAIFEGYKVRILRKARIPISVRRFEQEGRFVMAFKFLFWAFYRSFFGEVRSKALGYKWK